MNEKIKEFAIHEKDTGSSEIQVAQLTKKLEFYRITLKIIKKTNTPQLDCLKR